MSSNRPIKGNGVLSVQGVAVSHAHEPVTVAYEISAPGPRHDAKGRLRAPVTALLAAQNGGHASLRLATGETVSIFFSEIDERDARFIVRPLNPN